MTAQTASAHPHTHPAREMKGADCVAECLIREGVDVVFAYPGGASLELHQAFTKTDKFRVILPRHEQGGGFAANAYGRVTGKAGVCMATSGPGATNLVSAIADAYMDSVPMVAITGQVFSKYIGKSAFQETDFYGMTLPIVKHSFLVLNVHDLPRIFREAFHIATTGRPGPVVIDIPKDIQQAKFTPVWPVEMQIPAYKPEKHATDEQLLPILPLLAETKKPLLYVGGGAISAEAGAELKRFAEHNQIPVTTTLMGVGVFPETHPLSLRWFGMHGTVAGNLAADECDLLLCLGARFDDRVTGDTKAFARHAKIVHLDIDASEHNKNKRVLLPVVGDVKHALSRLNALQAERKSPAPDTAEWRAKCKAWQKEFPFSFDQSPHILPQEAVRTLYELTKGEAIVVTGVGQHQMWAAQYYEFAEPRRYVSSLGLGAMGFGYPAALGAKVARPDKQVVDIDGDGSFTMNIQELATAAIEKIGAKAMILNNQHLGMVVQWEDRFYNSVRGNTILGDKANIGGPENIDGLYPDFVKIAEGFGVKGRRVVKKSELRAAIQEMLDHDGPFVLDVVVPYSEHVLPMIPAGKTVKDMIIK
jgi:acetolactate synthase-1/2/3 large subunit